MTQKRRPLSTTECPLSGKGLVTFGVSYHETFDFFWIKGPLRCKADNFFGYDLE